LLTESLLGCTCSQEAIEYGLIDAIISKPQLLQLRDVAPAEPVAA
jgi:hypothetical protein